ncbi:MAG TPA: hypothetical protein VE664_03565 [Actinomycetes bacterium]|nr:hypothetical protein [Actinomycetes bacterium]
MRPDLAGEAALARPGANLRAPLERERPLVVPGRADALTAEAPRELPRRDGGSGALLDRLAPFPERPRLVGLPELEALPTLRSNPHGGDTRWLRTGGCGARSCAVAPAAACSSTWRTCRSTAARSGRCC